MYAQWTGEFIGRLHTYRITAREFAKYIQLDYRYVSLILNGHRSPQNAEQRFNEALDKLIAEKNTYAN